MAYAEVARRSTARLSGPPTLAGFRVAQAVQIHRFVVPHANHSFMIGPGRIGLLQLRDGVVEGVRISPHVEYLQGAACVAALDACAAALDGAGWRRDGQYSGEQAHTRSGLVEAALTGVWFTDELRARLTIRRVHTKDSAAGRLFALTQDVFVVTLQVCRDGVRTG
jgi:hypothetical protein